MREKSANLRSKKAKATVRSKARAGTFAKIASAPPTPKADRKRVSSRGSSRVKAQNATRASASNRSRAVSRGLSKTGASARAARGPSQGAGRRLTSHTKAPRSGVKPISRPSRIFARGYVWPAASACVIILALWSFYPVAKVQYREERHKAKLEAELKAIQARNERLRKEVERLRTPEGVEDLARTQLGLVKTGEHAVVVVDPSRESTLPGLPTIDSEPVVHTPTGPWTAALDAFFGYHE